MQANTGREGYAGFLMLTENQKFSAHMARVYLAEAKNRRLSKYAHQREFAHWLLSVAGKERLDYLNHIRASLKPKKEVQLGFSF